ncbi:zinc-ribbon and DUF3426 domain-containing protein [Nitrosomonas sp.]|uniref:zinc-ribbon and DUF3426 domain-containing protein n=1 Tax=Nitrosomonas sp. TaxID=42353 RepID=UPI001E005B74|nr:zinc-ribbon and DUF3426 domain-containing protein [Nitrosomonas sp.]MBX3617042.1 zinc-ribbon and DUF3426 domain-containing protein [Nitrosomonas sp.]
MALVTCCPSCSTTFRVHAAQLQAHGGDLRCGQCQRVFNGFATLITAHESTIEYPLTVRSQPAVAPESFTENHDVGPDSDATIHPVPAPASEPDAPESPDSLFDDGEQAKRSSPMLRIANILLLLLLVGQITHHYRTELTVIAPYSRPYLEQYCALLKCTIPYSQDIRQIGIESSDLQKNPAGEPEVTTMHATIHNFASFPQAFPALQLVLLDAQQHVITSRIFTADDYLQEEDRQRLFIAPHQDIEIRLDFDSTELSALGYRLLLLYL